MKEKYVAFLRGINVGGHHKVPMANLRAEMEKLGFVDVKTLLNSGNIVFTANSQDIKDVEVQVIGHNPDQYPKPFTDIEIKYIVKGNNLDPKAVERAIHLSESKYCIVSQSLQETVKINTTYEVRETQGQ